MYLGISIIEPKNYQFAIYFLQHSYQSNYLPKHKFKIIARYFFCDLLKMFDFVEINKTYY